MDDSYIAERRKYHRSRLLQGDKNTQENYEELKNWAEENSGAEKDENDIYGFDRYDWRWMIGMYQSH